MKFSIQFLIVKENLQQGAKGLSMPPKPTKSTLAFLYVIGSSV